MKFKNYRNSYTNDNKIYSYKDIYNMPIGEVLKRKQELLSQYRVLGVPTESELQASPDVVYVQAYTRDDGVKVKAHYRSKPDGITSNNISSKNYIESVNKFKEEIKNNITYMTKSAALQESAIKNMPISVVKSNPEQEYYRIAFELKKAKETGVIPEWMKEHNDIRTLDKIGNKDLAEKIKEKVIEGAKENGDIDTVNNPDNIYVVTAKMGSKITEYIVNNPYFQDELENKLDDISKGKYRNSYFSIDFPKSEHKIIADSNNDFSTHNTIGKCDVHNVEIGQNGYIKATIIDYYNFDKYNTANHARNAYIQQQNKHLKNYALVIPIRIKIKK